MTKQFALVELRRVPTIAHLSDLHFGREDPRVVAALSAQLNADPPDLIAVSGDFTQRATKKQYAAAARFYYGLPEPRIAVPGNHDVPLYNVFKRFFRPMAGFKRHIGETMRPTFDDGHLCVVGLNTARRLGRRWRGFWKDGILRESEIAYACKVFASTTAPLRILVAHHPLQVEHEFFAGDVVRLGKQALRALAAAGCDAILYGHIHVPHAILGVEDSIHAPRSMLCIMAGTATSVRVRLGSANSYNRIWFDGDCCTIDVMNWDGTTFSPAVSRSFVRDEAGWAEEKMQKAE
jgi:3',5'-cyclic AMP phosphodiesterase CpdA